MAGFFAVGYFLISLAFDLILFILWTRVALRYFRISSLNPFSRLIYTLTNPLVTPLYSLFRYKDKAQNKYDWLTLIAIIFMEFIKIILLSLVSLHRILPFIWLIIYVIADFIVQPMNFLFYAILLRVIMSYANPQWRHAITDVLVAVTHPLLVLGRKIIPDISGFDFSPFIMMLILQVLTLFVHASLPIPLL